MAKQIAITLSDEQYEALCSGDMCNFDFEWRSLGDLYQSAVEQIGVVCRENEQLRCDLAQERDRRQTVESWWYSEPDDVKRLWAVTGEGEFDWPWSGLFQDREIAEAFVRWLGEQDEYPNHGYITEAEAAGVRLWNRIDKRPGDHGAAESVTRPRHYTQLDPEPIEMIESWSLGFHLGNAVKYIARAGRKPGADANDDLEKAKWYLLRSIDHDGTRRLHPTTVGEWPLSDAARAALKYILESGGTDNPESSIRAAIAELSKDQECR